MQGLPCELIGEAARPVHPETSELMAWACVSSLEPNFSRQIFQSPPPDDNMGPWGPIQRNNKMSLRILSAFAAVLLLAACESAPSDTGMAAGGGGAGSSSSSANQGPRPGSQEDLVVNVGDRVFFDFDQFSVRQDQRAVLDRQAAWLKKYPEVTVTVEGHADERGTREYNIALGNRRATAAKNYLVALGINPNRVQTISYGKERPAVAGSNEQAWSQNRRAVTVVTARAGS